MTYDPTAEQRKAIHAYVSGTLTPLIEHVLVKQLGMAAVFLRSEIAAREAPALPEPYAWADATSNRCTRTKRADWTNPEPLFTAEQMREYAAVAAGVTTTRKEQP